ncbi:MAG: RpiB/LacA/LacB family sugar-phosphate isomerase [Lachnospiraceae bacterium]
MRLGYKIIAGADIASHDMKEEIIRLLREKGYEVTNADTSGPEHGDFTDAAEVVAKGIQEGKYQKGILLCGSGIGAAMAANKFTGVRAGLAYDLERAVLMAADNNTNVICTGGWLMPDAAYAVKMIEAWLLVKYTGRDTDGMKRAEIIEKDW